MRDKLRKWREDNCRNSEQIVDVGEELISEHASKLGDDSKFVMTPTRLFIVSNISNLPPHTFKIYYVSLWYNVSYSYINSTSERIIK